MSSSPIPIGGPNRGRSDSVSSADSTSLPGLSPGGSPGSPSSFQTPQMPNKPLVPSSPILSYFFPKDGAPKSPTAALAAAGGTARLRFPPTAVADDTRDKAPPSPTTAVGGHHRSLSMGTQSWARIPVTPVPAQTQAPASSTTNQATDRGAGLLRRLSLSTASFTRPVQPIPPPSSSANQDEPGLYRARTIGQSPASATSATFPKAKGIHARRATLAPAEGASRPIRAPSPMGERMLKGHFDGFV